MVTSASCFIHRASRSEQIGWTISCPRREDGGISDAALVLVLADDIGNLRQADPLPLAAQPIAAARPADTVQYAGMHQLLHDGLEIAAGNALAFADIAALNRALPGIIGSVEDSLDREHGFL